MTVSPLSVLRLKPKADARRLRHGHPWAWQDELVLDRRGRALPPGSLVVLEDADRQPLGMGTVSIEAKVAFRMLDRDPEAQINQDWFAARIAAAMALRERIYSEPYYRLINAEGDALPGLIVDRFGDTLVIQPNAVWLEDRLDMLCAALTAATGATTLVKNGASRARALEGLPEETVILSGQIDGPLPVPMNGATYLADLIGGQKTGLYYDQRPNHTFVAGLSKDARVLDMFAHVGGFGLAALAGGAKDVLAVDASVPALALAEGGASAMGASDRFSVRQGDAFDTLAALSVEAAEFDVVVSDPPAFAPSKSAMTAGLRAYERIARLSASVVAPGGILVLCSCSHAADLDKFRAACLRGIGRAGRDPRLIYTGFAGPDHPQHPALSETGYLKVLAFHLRP
ncbi:MAG: 23S rRNA (cytosine1962-C5)-methyltransferase [Paracoccaceae bacterium]|jgi:23S rRNA (cytosine1962-C5)-methyltransferase